jgi:hypothetical protein
MYEYAGCINEPGFAFPDYVEIDDIYLLEQSQTTCFKDDWFDNQRPGGEIASYFPGGGPAVYRRAPLI